MHEDLVETLSEQNGRLSLPIPDVVAKRYHLLEGVEMQVIQAEEGIMLRPLGVEVWVSVAWEQAMEDVFEYYGAVLERIGE